MTDSAGCFLSSIVGVLLVTRAVRRTGKASALVFILAGVIGLGAILTGAHRRLWPSPHDWGPRQVQGRHEQWSCGVIGTCEVLQALVSICSGRPLCLKKHRRSWCRGFRRPQSH